MQIDLILFLNDRQLCIFYSNQNFLSICVFLGDLHLVKNYFWSIDTILSEIATFPRVSETKISCP